MFCTRCGAQHDEMARFCPRCGQAVGVAAEVEASPVRRSRSWLWLVVLCTLALAGLAVLNWFVWPGPQLRQRANAPVSTAPEQVRQAQVGLTATTTEAAAVTPLPPAPSSSATLVASATPTQQPTATQTATPSPQPTPTTAPTATPSFTATPRPTARPTSANRPTATALPQCARSAGGNFAAIWQSARGRLGCPTNDRHATWSAVEQFEHGWMYWRQDSLRIYAMESGGKWHDLADTWREGDPERAGLTPPAGLLEPKRGFGKVWREKLGGPQAAIGWAVADERGINSDIQDFQYGVMLAAEGRIYVFYRDNASWVQP